MTVHVSPTLRARLRRIENEQRALRRINEELTDEVERLRHVVEEMRDVKTERVDPWRPETR